jgi:hypothetical protein
MGVSHRHPKISYGTFKKFFLDHSPTSPFAALRRKKVLDHLSPLLTGKFNFYGSTLRLFTSYSYPKVILQRCVFFKGVLIVTFDTNSRLPPLLSKKFIFYSNYLTRLFTYYFYPMVII